MKFVSVSMIFLVLLIVSFPVNAKDIEKEERDEVIGLFGTLLAPSIFTTASPDNIAFSMYGRTLTGEGEVPDFDGSIEDNIDELQVFLNGRFGGLGATIGFGQGNEFEFSQPLIVSVDYKSSIERIFLIMDAAIDAQYSMIYLPEEENIKLSALGFGVFSINGILSAEVFFLFEPYVGVTLNYVYLKPKDEDTISVWKPVPKAGLKLKLLPFVDLGTEVTFINNERLNSSWVWNIGASARF